eukprot:scaffold167_cov244-Pinguiococcus_pyrenoidosus.AAC.3
MAVLAGVAIVATVTVLATLAVARRISSRRHVQALEQKDLVRGGQHVHVVRDEHDTLLTQKALDAMLKDVSSHLAVDGAEAVVQEVHVRIIVNGSGQGHALLLSTAEVDALLPDLGRVAGRQLLQVWKQRAGGQDSGVPHVVVLAAEENVIAHGAVLDPRGLGDVGDATLRGDASVGGIQVADEAVEQAGLSRPRASDHCAELPALDLDADAVDQGRSVRPAQLRVFRAQQRHAGLDLHVRGPPDAQHRAGGARAGRCQRRARYGRKLLHFGRPQEVPQPRHGKRCLHGVADHHREHRKREAEDVEQRKSRKGLCRGQGMTRERVRREGRHGDENRHDRPQEPRHERPEHVLVQRAQLALSDAVNLRPEGLLPRVQLQDLDAGQDLVRDLDALILDAHQAFLQLPGLRSDQAGERHDQNHHSHASEDARSNLLPQEDQAQGDLIGRGHEHREVRHEILHPLGVHRHQVDDLSCRLLRGLLAVGSFLAAGGRFACLVVLVEEGLLQLLLRLLSFALRRGLVLRGVIGDHGACIHAQRLPEDHAHHRGFQAHPRPVRPVEILVQHDRLRQVRREHERDEDVAFISRRGVVLRRVLNEADDAIQQLRTHEEERVVDELQDDCDCERGTEALPHGTREGRAHRLSVSLGSVGLLGALAFSRPGSFQRLGQNGRPLIRMQRVQVLLLQGSAVAQRDERIQPGEGHVSHGRRVHLRAVLGSIPRRLLLAGQRFVHVVALGLVLAPPQARDAVSTGRDGGTARVRRGVHLLRTGAGAASVHHIHAKLVVPQLAKLHVPERTEAEEKRGDHEQSAGRVPGVPLEG